MQQKKIQLSHWLNIIYLIAAIVFYGSPAFSNISVEADLSPKSFSVSERAQFTITVNGSSRSVHIDLPKIKSISFQSRGTSRQFSSINGTVSSSLVHSYSVQASSPGKYTIPPITVTVKKTPYTTKPIPFTVLTNKQFQTNTQSSNDVFPEDDAAFIQLTKVGEHYPGEMVPIQIQVFFNQKFKFNLSEIPKMTNNGVVMEQLSNKPHQTEEIIGNNRYHVLTWETNLTGIKAGQHNLLFSLDATLLIPVKRKQVRPRGIFDDSFFNDPFFNSFLGGYEKKPITVTSQPTTFEVIPLPTKNQPANFSGAIGNFDLTVEATPKTVEIGEPITVTIKVSGTGNFDRVEAPQFITDPNWKTYSPTTHFIQGSSKNSGVKSFEQAVVAKSPQISNIPALSFSYFDPEEKMYITKTSEPIPLDLKISDNIRTAENTRTKASPAPLAHSQIEPAQESLNLEDVKNLAPLHLKLNQFVSTLTPLYTKRWYQFTFTLLLLLLLSSLGYKQYKKRIAANPQITQKKQLRKRLEDDLIEIESVLENNDGATFLNKSRKAIQNQLGPLWDVEPSTISSQDLILRLKPGLTLIDIFQQAEAAAYGGLVPDKEKMKNQVQQLKQELEELT